MTHSGRMPFNSGATTENARSPIPARPTTSLRTRRIHFSNYSPHDPAPGADPQDRRCRRRLGGQGQGTVGLCAKNPRDLRIRGLEERGLVVSDLGFREESLVTPPDVGGKGAGLG